MRINKLLTLLLVAISIGFYGSVNAATTGFSQSEIAHMFTIAQEKVNSQSVRQWVRSIQNHQVPTESINPNKNAFKRRAALMILVSKSMPVPSLHQYLVDALKVNATLVLRGLVNNSFQDTAKFIHQALMGTKGGFKVDPIVFEKLHISRVPAIVLFNSAGLACINQRDCVPDPNDYDMVTGNVTLSYALKEMTNRGTADPQLAKQLLDKLRKASDV